MYHISVDLETYSSVDLTKSGLYKYVQSPDFEILLIGYAINGGPVVVIDMLDDLPEYSENFINWLLSPESIIHAYNAAFEFYCLCRWLESKSRLYDGRELLGRFRCTMVHGLYCGYPDGLKDIGAALGLPQDKQKSRAGSSLIEYFCSPCKPTRANGNRTRNLPRHDPEKWYLFKQYNAQDVVTEMEVERRLANYPVPEEVQRQWETDIIINCRGVAVDIELMDGALFIGNTIRQQLKEEAVRISGLDNPNSLKQLSTWLEEEIDEEVDNLRKETVTDLLKRDIGSDAARRMLEIRQALGKTSVTKYDAMENAVCADGRVRGMLRFYKANRTGRWAGAIVQPQNLPQTHLPALDAARKLVKARNADGLRIIYGSIPDTLSQLIRTALVAAPGHVLIDADFSAIEARILSWLAGEEWVLEVFRTHGKIYEACASQMFGVPMNLIVKGKPEYSLRQKGKVATLALGYQGSTGALINMGALRMGLSESELPDIVSRWRSANPRIRDFWYALDSAAVSVVQNGTPVGVNGLIFAREYDPANDLDFMTITLPSGRKLYYVKPFLTTNQWGNPAIGYYGMNQKGKSKQWQKVESYGGKLAENITQAVARDCLAEAITRLEAEGFRVVFHVHDEVVIELCSVGEDENTFILDDVCRILSAPIPWAPSLPLGADGWAGGYYRKE